jgi:3-hydroxyacyl-CoA dehydrogenase / enoyl-CoA hydratase / 3-hydroxybutyryl-CoA epimerase
MLESSIRVIDKGPVALVELDEQGSKVNKWSFSMVKHFAQILEELKISSYQAVVFISRKPHIFVAGADIDEIRQITSQEVFYEGVKQGQNLFNALEDLPQVTIAAIHGVAAGGGCEFALACDYRIATDDSVTRIGLPEVQLGIIPGFGGCIRLPRLVGLESALDLILTGKLLPSQKALKIGLVDMVVHQNQLESKALEWAQKKKKRNQPFQAKGLRNIFLESCFGRFLMMNQAKKSILKKTQGHYPAPLKALEVISQTYLKYQDNRSLALEIERRHFCEVAVTPISKNLIHVFDLTEMVKKQTGIRGVEVQPQQIHHMGILGAGTMGGGIAFVAADKGLEVRMKDRQQDALLKGLKQARFLWSKLVKKKKTNILRFRTKIFSGNRWSDL